MNLVKQPCSLIILFICSDNRATSAETQESGIDLFPDTATLDMLAETADKVIEVAPPSIAAASQPTTGSAATPTSDELKQMCLG